MKIPFDALCLASVADELSPFVGGKVQGVRQPNETDVLIALYNGGEAWLLLSASAEFGRAYLTTRRPPNPPVPPTFCATLRARLDGLRLEGIEVPDGERMMTLSFSDGHRLVAELMGKHGNVILVDPGGRVVGALKWVPKSQSVRPIVSGAPYVRPPVLGQGGGSPFYAKLRAAGGGEGEWRPVLSPGNGAYPFSVAPLGLPELARGSISIALEQHFATAIPAAEAASLRAQLLGPLRRILLAREAVVADLSRTVAVGERAGELQKIGDLILAYGPSAPPEASEIEAWDYEGNPTTLPIDPDVGWKATAERYFRRAKKAKARLVEVREQGDRLRAEAAQIQAGIARVEAATSLADLVALRDEARERRWIQSIVQKSNKADARPYEGHRVRELLAPGGWTVLYGENAESNDYLTLRIARSGDIWMHVRGATSAHVVIQTRNQPDRVQHETLEFAARTAVRNSPAKHSKYVAVDYTLKKYVRKPRGSAKGSALYSHEKTLHIEGE